MNNNNEEKTAITLCSFCGKRREQVERLTAGPGGNFICNECVDHYRQRIEDGDTDLFATADLTRVCSSCGARAPKGHRYCFNCGSQFAQVL